jgi:hypothetical protein
VDSKSTSTNSGPDECDCGVKVTGGNHSHYCSSIKPGEDAFLYAYRLIVDSKSKPGEEFKIEYKWVIQTNGQFLFY